MARMIALILSSLVALPSMAADKAQVSPAYELQAVYNGDIYIADYGLTSNECWTRSQTIAEIELYPGIFISAADAELHCANGESL